MVNDPKVQTRLVSKAGMDLLAFIADEPKQIKTIADHLFAKGYSEDEVDEAFKELEAKGALIRHKEQ